MTSFPVAKNGDWFNYAGAGGVRAVRHGSLRWMWHAYGRRGFFRSVDLNAAGWLAVLAPGIAIGTATAIAIGWPVAVLALLGAVATWAVALAFDARAHRKAAVSVQASGMIREQLQPVIDRLKSRGINVTVSENTVTESTDPDNDQTSISIHSTMRHLRAIHAELERARQDRGH